MSAAREFVYFDRMYSFLATKVNISPVFTVQAGIQNAGGNTEIAERRENEGATLLEDEESAGDGEEVAVENIDANGVQRTAPDNGEVGADVDENEEVTRVDNEEDESAEVIDGEEVGEAGREGRGQRRRRNEAAMGAAVQRARTTAVQSREDLLNGLRQTREDMQRSGSMTAGPSAQYVQRNMEIKEIDLEMRKEEMEIKKRDSARREKVLELQEKEELRKDREEQRKERHEARMERELELREKKETLHELRQAAATYNDLGMVEEAKNAMEEVKKILFSRN